MLRPAPGRGRRAAPGRAAAWGGPGHAGAAGAAGGRRRHAARRASERRQAHANARSGRPARRLRTRSTVRAGATGPKVGPTGDRPPATEFRPTAEPRLNSRVNYGGEVPEPLLAVLAGLVTCQLALLLTTMYLHRTLSHRAVTMRPGLAFACRAMLWISTGIRPREWAAVHRRHHAYTDVLGDPHSPLLEGYWKVQLYNVGLYKKAAHDAETLRKYSRDIKRRQMGQVRFRPRFIGLVLGIGILWAAARLALGPGGRRRPRRHLPLDQFRHQRRRATVSGSGPIRASPPTTSGWPFSPGARGCIPTTMPRPPRPASPWSPARSTWAGGSSASFKKLRWLEVRHADVHLTALAQTGLGPGARRSASPSS